ncbi:hypothetical protein [Streptomyces iconiensis]|uniref:hypothetical protein n=1 Tax=Streptomyces iconiensis TaxID=1384038 RepID=UPI00321B0B8F
MTLTQRPDPAARTWTDTLTALPRAAFLPDRMWPWDMTTRTSIHVDRRTDPDLWQQWAEADAPIVTQWDDGHHAGPEPGTVPTSSSSMPHVVAGMLADLDAQPGMRVLEIGTGVRHEVAHCK